MLDVTSLDYLSQLNGDPSPPQDVGPTGRCSRGPGPIPGVHLVTGGDARLKDLRVTVPALLVAHDCKVGYTLVIEAADALKYGRLSHVDQTYLRLATYRRRTPR
jgi:hypothetical protein